MFILINELKYNGILRRLGYDKNMSFQKNKKRQIFFIHLLDKIR